MSLTDCEECGGQVSTKARSCPRCGAHRRNGPVGRLVKAALYLFLAYVLFVAVALLIWSAGLE